MDCKKFLESVIKNSYHTIESLAEMLDIPVQELTVSEDFSEQANKALIELFHFLKEYSLIHNDLLIDKNALCIPVNKYH